MYNPIYDEKTAETAKYTKKPRRERKDKYRAAIIPIVGNYYIAL